MENINWIRLMGVTNALTSEQIIQMLQKENSDLKKTISDQTSEIVRLKQQLWEAEKRYEESTSRVSLWRSILRR